MSNVWGRNITLAIFGESHGAAIGVTIGGLPPGFAVDFDAVRCEMARRKPGGELATPRQEDDLPEILSGIFGGRTTGAPLAAIIRNNDARSRDYNANIMRPGHADYAAYIKYHGYSDYRGGGHFSGRLTAPLVFAGSIARQLLASRGITVGARLKSVAGIPDADAEPEAVIEAAQKPFPTADDGDGERMKAAIRQAAQEHDSVGGVVECVALGVPAGCGEPFFDALESTAAHLLFAIPAVKGVEFGAGFAIAHMRGSHANDAMLFENRDVRFMSNNNGGVTGGISNGQPFVVRAAIKPTPTVGTPQTTVDIAASRTVTAEFGGRHDPCIAPRAVPVVEAAIALCLLDQLYDIKESIQ